MMTKCIQLIQICRIKSNNNNAITANHAYTQAASHRITGIRHYTEGNDFLNALSE